MNNPELWGSGDDEGRRRAYGFVDLLAKVRLPRVAVLVFRRSLPLRHRRTPMFSPSSASRRRAILFSRLPPTALPLKPFTTWLHRTRPIPNHILLRKLLEMGRSPQGQCSKKFSSAASNRAQLKHNGGPSRPSRTEQAPTVALPPQSRIAVSQTQLNNGKESVACRSRLESSSKPPLLGVGNETPRSPRASRRRRRPEQLCRAFRG